MIINNVLLKMKSRDEDTIKKAQTILLSMKGNIEVLLDLKVELCICPSSSTYDLLLITHFRSLKDFDSYLSHPVHLEVAKYISSVLDEQASLCYEIK